MNDQVKGKPKATGYFGIWDTRNKKFLFGIQERTRKEVHYTVGKRIGWKQYYRKPHWIVKPIRECHASMFFKGLKYKNKNKGGKTHDKSN